MAGDNDVIWDMSPEGPWQSRKGIELEGKTMGLIGFGTVGQQVADQSQRLWHESYDLRPLSERGSD